MGYVLGFSLKLLNPETPHTWKINQNHNKNWNWLKKLAQGGKRWPTSSKPPLHVLMLICVCVCVHNMCALETSMSTQKPVQVEDTTGVLALLCCSQQSSFKSVVRRLLCSLKLKNLCNLSPSGISVSACWTSLKKWLSFNKLYTFHVLKKGILLANPISCHICKLICFLGARMIYNSQQS